MTYTNRSTLASIFFLIILISGSNQLIAENNHPTLNQVPQQNGTRFVTASTSGVLGNLLAYTYVINTSDTWEVNKRTNINVSLFYETLGIGLSYFTISSDIVLYNTYEGLIVEEVYRMDEGFSFDNTKTMTVLFFSFTVSADYSHEVKLNFTSNLSEGLFSSDYPNINTIDNLELISVTNGGTYAPRTTTDEHGNTTIVSEFNTYNEELSFEDNPSSSLFDSYAGLVMGALIVILAVILYPKNSNKKEGDNNSRKQRSRKKLNDRMKEVKTQFEQE